MRSLLVLLMLAGLAGLSSAAKAQSDIPAIDANKWKLVWADEFEGDTLDQSKWSYLTDCWGGGNDERQCYTDRSKNISLNDGVLAIKAHREKIKGFAYPEHMRDSDKRKKKTKKQPYTSGRIRSLNKGDWLYGRFDIRAKLPGGQGTWPAIWMLPSDEQYGGWAASGEIDIMETVNLGAPCEDESCKDGIETRVHGTLHYGDKWPENKYSGSATYLGDSIADWHTYSIVWSAGVITWYLDGQQYARQTMDDWFTNSNKAEGSLLAPFDQRFHMILNLAIGGEWPERNGNGVDKSGFPKSMEIDFVRVYECASDPELGLDCVSL